MYSRPVKLGYLLPAIGFININSKSGKKCNFLFKGKRFNPGLRKTQAKKKKERRRLRERKKEHVTTSHS